LTQSQKILHKSWTLQSIEAEVQKVGRIILDHTQGLGYEEDTVFAIHLALEEALINAVKHGNKSDPSKKVTIDCLITPEKFDISITDEGPGFHLQDLPDPRCDHNLYKCSGRGVLLIQAYMDTVEYYEQGNSIHLVKYRQFPEAEKGSTSENCSE
jgi:serine/threonine-protein kinase RsbW